jgi:hypothetical protein
MISLLGRFPMPDNIMTFKARMKGSKRISDVAVKFNGALQQPTVTSRENASSQPRQIPGNGRNGTYAFKATFDVAFKINGRERIDGVLDQVLIRQDKDHMFVIVDVDRGTPAYDFLAKKLGKKAYVDIDVLGDSESESIIRDNDNKRLRVKQRRSNYWPWPL